MRYMIKLTGRAGYSTFYLVDDDGRYTLTTIRESGTVFDDRAAVDYALKSVPDRIVMHFEPTVITL